MKTCEFDFKKHQDKRINWKTLIRLTIYITVVLFLIIFILHRQKTTINDPDNGTIQQFDIEIDSSSQHGIGTSSSSVTK